MNRTEMSANDKDVSKRRSGIDSVAQSLPPSVQTLSESLAASTWSEEKAMAGAEVP